MAQGRHVTLLWEGAERIAKWRADNPDVVLDLSGANFFKSPSEKANLENADLSDADFSNANLSELNLQNANFKNSKFTGANLKNADLRKADLQYAILESADLSGANMSYADLYSAVLSNANMSAVDLEKSNLSDAILDKAYMTGANLVSAHLPRARMNETQLCGAKLNYANLVESDLTSADLSGTELKSAYLYKASMVKTNLDGADLRKAIIIGANLTGTSIREANLLGIKINSTTKLESVADVVDCMIDRYSLEYLRTRKEILTDGMAMDMNVQDDLAVLRSQFGGLWGAIHLTSIILFFAPYLWFLISIRPIADFNINVSTAVYGLTEGSPRPEKIGVHESSNLKKITILNALGRYIWSGGVDWAGKCELNYLSFPAFMFFLFYNANRFLLLWKTKKLETIETVTGLPVRFSLTQLIIDKFAVNENIPKTEEPRHKRLLRNITPSWMRIYKIVYKGIWVYIGLVILSTYNFLTMEILI